ncbi:hypothetical protein KC345_g11836, partial [Hortaea werneckii]
MKETILALEWGAFDFIRKPSISNSQDIIAVGESLREQMKEAMLAREQREARATAIKAPEQATSEEPVLPAPPAPPKTVIEPVKRSPVFPKKDSDMLRKPPAEIVKPKGRTPLENEADKRTIDKPTADSVISKRAVKPDPAEPKPASEKFRNRPKQDTGAVLPDLRSVQEVAAGSSAPPPAPVVSAKGGNKGLRKLVAVGCSTGGPRALKSFLENIPGDFPAPIVIVQHMPPNFTKSLAQRLNTFSSLEVAEAEHGMVLRQGAAYIAPGGYHLKVVPATGGQYSIELTKEEARNGHRPSVDTLFESVLQLTSLERHAVIMTGMGSDGAKMMKALYDSGVTSTFAE